MPQPQESGDAICHLLDAIGLGYIEQTRATIHSRLFERDRTGKNPAIQFRQNDMHGKIGGIETARIFRPAVPSRRRHHYLKHRHAEPVEQCFTLVIRLAGEGGGGNDGGGFEIWQHRFEETDRLAILQAADKNRQGCKTALRERFEERIHRCSICRQKHGAVKEDRQKGRTGGKTLANFRPIHDAPAGSVETGFRQRFSLDIRPCLTICKGGKTTGKPAHILLPTLAEEGEGRGQDPPIDG
ncbi:hypothetical protein D3C86_1329970 [compost metagenome]